MPLSDVLTSMGTSLRQIMGNKAKYSLHEMVVFMKSLKMDSSKEVALRQNSAIMESSGNYTQMQINSSQLSPNATYALTWDSSTTGTDKKMSLRIYDPGTNTALPGCDIWGGIFVFDLGPQVFTFTVPAGQPLSLFFAKNIDSTSGGDGTTTFSNIHLYKVGGGN